MYDCLQSRSRTGGVAEIEIRILAPVARTFFVLPAMRGDHILYEFRKSQLILGLTRASAPNPFSCQVRFSGPPLRKCTLFLLDDSSAGMGTSIFHQNHGNSFGVTNSNMKTLARSKKTFSLICFSKRYASSRSHFPIGPYKSHRSMWSQVSQVAHV